MGDCMILLPSTAILHAQHYPFCNDVHTKNRQADNANSSTDFSNFDKRMAKF